MMRQDFTRTPNPWAWVKGPLGNVQMIMSDLGIHMPTPYIIRIPTTDGFQEWRYQHGSQTAPFLKQLEDHITEQLWTRATRHRDSSELRQEGFQPDLRGVRKQYQYMIRHGRHADASLMITIASGALWPNMRVALQNYRTPNRMPLM